MKKLGLALGMILVMGLVANVAFTDETIPFPFWQHGSSVMSFWSVTNDGAANATVTIRMMDIDGNEVQATTATISPQTAWMPDTAYWGGWYTGGDGLGFGYYEIQAAADQVYLWGCVYAFLPNMQPGYTVIMPGNPYGN